jgi:replication fork clamp-binding protein CrfC
LYKVILKLHENAQNATTQQNFCENQSARSQKVLAGSASSSWYCTLVLGDGTENAEFGIQILADVHDRGNITTAVAIVGSRPNGYNGLVCEVVL